MKIRIIGGCGSGKTYIAQLISVNLGIPHIQTDNLVWNRSNNTKYPDEVRDRLLAEVLRSEAWIIEGVHYRWGYNSFQEADYIFIIRNHWLTQDLRTIKRFVATRLGWRVVSQNAMGGGEANNAVYSLVVLETST